MIQQSIDGLEKEHGERNLDLSQWYTPAWLADEAVKPLIDSDRAAKSFLEPSAGNGALSLTISSVYGGVYIDCIDADPHNVEILNNDGYNCNCWDFLEVIPWSKYDRVIMNPPYENGADGLHIAHALKFSKRVTAIIRVAALCGADRYERLWSKCNVIGIKYCIRRPKFSDEGSAKSDFCIVDIGPDRGNGVKVEWIG